MTQADKNFIETCKEILEHGYSSEGTGVRTRWEDGSEANYISIVGVTNKYDLSKEFPMITLRNNSQTVMRAIDEILWIWQKKSNNVKDLNSHIWDQWADEQGTIGKAYGYQLAKKYPFIKIFAYEPIFTSYKCFIRNISSNNLPDNIIYITRKALTLDGKNVSMIVNPHNSKDCKVSETQKEGYIIRAEDRLVESTTLDNIFLENNLGKVKLMRIDCNGDEHEILKNCSPKTLKKIENLVGEFYETPERPDRDHEDLIKYCKQYIKKLNVISIRK